MSGHNVAYHLRTNKHVERRVFLDTLSRVRAWNGSAEYCYVSLGGQFLEDFRYVNEYLGIEKMLCLEEDESIHKRQLFNLPLGFIQCDNCSTEEFVDNFDTITAKDEGVRFIVWLDFTRANERHRQLSEFQQLISKMRPGDIAKITLNANHASKRKRTCTPSRADYETLLLEALREDLGEFTPTGGIAKKHLNPKAYACYLADATRISATKGVGAATDLEPRILSACRYTDGVHQMLTVCLVIADKEMRSSIDDDSTFRSDPFRSQDWGQIHLINVPALSLRERHEINSLIGTKGDAEIHEGFGYLFAENEKDSAALISDYIKHYRRHPGFAATQTA